MKSRGTEKWVCIPMEKPKTFVLLSVLAAGSLLFGMASYALSGGAAEESRREAVPAIRTETNLPVQNASRARAWQGQFLLLATIQSKFTRRLRENSCARSSQMS